MKVILSTVLGCVSLGVAVPRAASAESPVLEITDHSRGFTFVTTNDAWAFSPIGKHAIIILKSGSSIKINKAFGKQTDEEAVAKAKVSIDKNEKEKLLQDNEKVSIAGTVTAPAITVERTAYGTKVVQLLWFSHRDVQYAVTIEFDPAKDPDFKKEAHTFLQSMELF